MNFTRWVMSLAAIVLGLAGIMLVFAPDEIAVQLDLNNESMVVLGLQILGALYFGFAVLNWMTKDHVLGGIYGRPVVIANLSHFIIGGLSICKASFRQTGFTLFAIAFTYALFAVLFAVILFRYPFKTINQNSN